MSLLLESALGQFDPDTADLVSTDAFEDDQQLASPLAIDVIADYATYHDELSENLQGYKVRLPLHTPEDAELTDEYVLFCDHEIRGTLFGGRNADGDVQWVAADTLLTASIAARLRFWHPDEVPTEMPSYFESPVDIVEPAQNPLESNEELLAGLRTYVDKERSAERATNYDRLQRSTIRELVDDDAAVIPSLRCDGPQDGVYQFRVQDAPSFGVTIDHDEVNRTYYIPNRFGIYEGNEVLIHTPEGVTQPEFPVRAVVESIQATRLELDVDWGAVESKSKVGAVLNRSRVGYALTGLLNPVPFNRQYAAIDDLRTDSTLAAVLAGQQPLTFDNNGKAASEPLDDALNQDQQLAVEYALLADQLFCIHGPPGTGKTRTLVEFVRRSVQAGRDVLVCADSNQAVDNLLIGSSTEDKPDKGSLHAYGQHGTNEFVTERRNARRSSQPLVEQRYQTRTPERADVVATTNSSAGRIARDFDVVVIDEATQATCAASCVPLSRAEKVVLAGDHRQLPPYSATDEPAASKYGLSLFEHIYADGGVYEDVGVQLQTQYRMHKNIAYYPNRAFYNRTLRNGRRVPELDRYPPTLLYSIGGREEQVEHSWRNETEANLVAVLVKQLLSDGVSPREIGVITPYQAQTTAIQSRLRSLDEAREVGVDTIDSFQGSEREVILISFVRSNKHGDIGFLGRPEDGPRRLNVAMTRAKRHCALIGDWNTLRGHRHEEPAHGCVDLYRDLYNIMEESSHGSSKRPRARWPVAFVVPSAYVVSTPREAISRDEDGRFTERPDPARRTNRICGWVL
ncbi:AAA domain-containing protein [Haloprofundus marisrubri]|uniref:AAA domain-containing protein n=1 Tax=Haloprofundus marisrubri TaxID=1514971 RepID=UPI0009E3A474|nr:AAA domain-containing protein [Haloprofundus marisrubri]